MLLKLTNENKREKINWSVISEISIGHINTKQRIDITRDKDSYNHGPRIKIPDRSSPKGHGVSIPIIINSEKYYDYDQVMDDVSTKKVGDAANYLPLIAGFAVFNQKELKTLVVSKDDDEKSDVLTILKNRWIEHEKKYTRNGGSVVEKNKLRKDANQYAEDMNNKK